MSLDPDVSKILKRLDAIADEIGAHRKAVEKVGEGLAAAIRSLASAIVIHAAYPADGKAGPRRPEVVPFSPSEEGGPG